MEFIEKGLPVKDKYPGVLEPAFPQRIPELRHIDPVVRLLKCYS